ncbi:MAG: gamma-glutamyltransferase [Pyrinomonadaceae bacterium]
MSLKRRALPLSLTLLIVFAPFGPLTQRTGITSSVAAATRAPVRAPHGMVASANKIASEVGVDVLQRGGNAVDAAIAVAFALAVTYPSAGNLGGGGFMLLRLRDGRTTAIDYREMAPASATRNIYLDEKGNLIEGEGSSTVGYRAAGVPGTVAGMALALQKYGSHRLTWAQLVEPARRLAANGFPVSYALANGLRGKEKDFKPYADSRRIYLNNGRFYKEGDMLRQPELAATFTRLQRGGAREFYEGETAHLIAADMQRHNGLMTLADLRGYVAKERVPVRTTYRGNEIVSMPPPSSGGVILIEMLNILEGYDLRAMGWSSADRYHVTAETMRRAYADRAEYLGDADYANVPVAGLIDKTYAARQRGTINMERASSSDKVRAGLPAGAESAETTHFTVVDRDGNVVANTYTLNSSYGGKVVAHGTGFLLNNEMDDFAAKPGTANLYGLIQGERNAVAPHKRPLSAMTPTIVLHPDGSVWFTVGSPGGSTIINTVMQVITNVIDFDMNIQQAIDAPRIHHQWFPDELAYEPYGLSTDTLRILLERGHKLFVRPNAGWTTGGGYMGDAQGIMIEPKTGARLGASDSRHEGVAIGY